MILADKIIALRKENGWSQEELADKMNVSRQSVSKWESAASIPDINKIIELSKIFGVTTDFLIKDENKIEEYSKDDDSSIRKITLSEAETFMKTVKQTSKKFASAVTMCIISPVTLVVLDGLADEAEFNISQTLADVIGAVILFLIVAAAVAMFIMSAFALKPYEFLNKNEDFELEYGISGIVSEKKKAFNRKYIYSISIGTVLCILSIIPLIISSIFDPPDYIYNIMSGILLIIVSIAVHIIILAAMEHSSYDKLLQTGDFTQGGKKASGLIDKTASVYWPIMVAIYFITSFATKRWDMTWIIWPISGVLFGVISAIFRSMNNEK